MTDTQTITIAFRNRDQLREVEARPVAPGLAIHAVITRPGDRSDYPRFTLTHLSSRKSLISNRCEAHVEQATQIARESGIDWTQDADRFDPDQLRTTVGQAFKEQLGSYCTRRCDGLAASWKVTCHTCGWVAGDDEADDPMDFNDARAEAREHRCQPEVSMAAPDSNRWEPEWRYSADGTLPQRDGA